jgi:hypothetical protein
MIIITFFIILIILIFIYYFFFKKKYTETFDNNCIPSTPCSTQNGFGIFTNDCICQLQNLSSYDTIFNQNEENSQYNMNQEQEQQEEQEEGITTNCTNSTFGCCPTNPTISKIDNIGSNCPDCIDSTDFSQYCSNINPNYGVSNIENCGNNKYRVKCGIGYIGGVSYNDIYDDNLVTTPCLDNNIDFNTMCRYYNNQNIPKGYNINSIAAKTILKGKDGDCYNSNGIPNKNKARAICSNNYFDTVKKLNPSKTSHNNLFTNCHLINSNFDKHCQNKYNENNIYSYDKMGYDCLPGFARAKCSKPNNNFNDNINNILQSIYTPFKTYPLNNCCKK